MKTNNLSDRIVAAIASIAITAGLAQGTVVLARNESGAGAPASAAAARIACAPSGVPHDLHTAS